MLGPGSAKPRRPRRSAAAFSREKLPPPLPLCPRTASGPGLADGAKTSLMNSPGPSQRLSPRPRPRTPPLAWLSLAEPGRRLQLPARQGPARPGPALERVQNRANGPSLRSASQWSDLWASFSFLRGKQRGRPPPPEAARSGPRHLRGAQRSPIGRAASQTPPHWLRRERDGPPLAAPRARRPPIGRPPSSRWPRKPFLDAILRVARPPIPSKSKRNGIQTGRPGIQQIQ